MGIRDTYLDVTIMRGEQVIKRGLVESISAIHLRKENQTLILIPLNVTNKGAS